MLVSFHGLVERTSFSVNERMGYEQCHRTNALQKKPRQLSSKWLKQLKEGKASRVKCL